MNSISPRTASSQETVPSFGWRKRIAPSSSYALPSASSFCASSRAVSAVSSWNVTVAVPVDPEPDQRVLDLIDRLGHLAARVGVLDPQQDLAALLAREEPVEEERADAADVEEAGGARSHADADAHRASIVGGGGIRRAHVSASGGIDTAIDRDRGDRRRLRPGVHAEPADVAADEPQARGDRALQGAARARLGSAASSAMRSTSATSRRPTTRSTRSRYATMRATVDAACAIEADGVIFHVGSHLGAGFEAGLERTAAALAQILERCEGDTWLLMENSAGTGATIGRSIEELAGARRAPRPASAARHLPRLVPPLRVRATTSRIRRRSTRSCAEVDARIGLDRLRALHINDSATPLGSNRDRHANILEGDDGRGPRRIPRAPRVPAPRARTSRSRARASPARTRTRSGSCASCTRAGQASSRLLQAAMSARATLGRALVTVCHKRSVCDSSAGRRRMTSEMTFAQAAETHLDDVYGYLAWFTGDRGAADDLTGRDVRARAPALAPLRPRAVARRAPGSARSRARSRSTTSAPRSGACGARSSPPCPSASTSGSPKASPPTSKSALRVLTAGEREVVALRVVLELDARHRRPRSSGSRPPTARRASTARSRSSRRHSMSQRDLAAELRAARIPAPVRAARARPR